MLPLLLTANVDNNFSSFALSHAGQVGLVEPMTSVQTDGHIFYTHTRRGA